MLGAVCSIVIFVLFLWGVYILLLKLEDNDNRTYQRTKHQSPMTEQTAVLKDIPEMNKPVRKKSFRNRCAAKTGGGKRCQNKAKYNSYCSIHAGNYKEALFTCRDCNKDFKTKNGAIWHSHSTNHTVLGYTKSGAEHTINPEKSSRPPLVPDKYRRERISARKLPPKKQTLDDFDKPAKPAKVKSRKSPRKLGKDAKYDLDYFNKNYGYEYSFSDRKVGGLSVEDGLEAISGLPFLSFSPITVAVFCLVHHNKKKIHGAYRKEIKAEIDEYLKDKISYKYISHFILELYGKTNFDNIPKGDGKYDVEVAFKYSKKMLRRVVLIREGISPKEATLEFQKSPVFKKSSKILETLSDKVLLLNNFKLRTCNKCRLVGVENIWFGSYKKRKELHYKKSCKICG